MKYLILFLCALGVGYSQSTNLTVQGDVRVKGGHVYIGTDTILHNVGLDVNPRNLSGATQIGIYAEPYCNSAATVGCVGFRIRPKTTNGSGHIPYMDVVDIYPPLFGTASGAKRIYGLYLNSIQGSDSGNYAIYTNDGLIRFGDTTTFNRITQFGASVQYHGRVVNSSQRLGDSDYVILCDGSGGRVVDTLPALTSSIGRQYVFIQSSTTMAGNYVVRANPGDKIETYDSLVMHSNNGRSKLILINSGAKWSILYQHEEGFFGATLTGVSGTISDTAFYTRDNLNFKLQYKPLRGTSTSGALTVTGADTRMYRTGTDSTYTSQAAVYAYNNSLPVEASCIFDPGSGILTCQNISAGFAAWTSVGVKGLAYGFTIQYTLPNQPTN